MCRARVHALPRLSIGGARGDPAHGGRTPTRTAGR
jgi:hypothetical protein